MKAITHQNDAWELWRPGVESRMLVSARNSATQLCIFEQWIVPGVGAPTHSHPVEEVLTVRVCTAFAIAANRSCIFMRCWRRRFLRLSWKVLPR